MTLQAVFSLTQQRLEKKTQLELQAHHVTSTEGFPDWNG